MERFEAVFLAQTEAGIKVNIENEEVWLPKSKIELDEDFDDLEDGQDIEVGVPQWICDKEGLA